MKRSDNRRPDQMRPLKIEKDVLRYALGSCLVSLGRTRVICAASLEENVPGFLKGSGQGWITAEYSLLPFSCPNRVPREASRGRLSGRTQEIQRLIGRAMRQVIADLSQLGERTIWIDCDVLDADGGTRTASIIGGSVALTLAISRLRDRGMEIGIKTLIAAISVGIYKNEVILDLSYEEDAYSDVDMNIVMTQEKEIVEIQGTAERAPFSQERLTHLLSLAAGAIGHILKVQRACLGLDR